MKPQPLAILFVLLFGALVVIQNYDAQGSTEDQGRTPIAEKGEYEVVPMDTQVSALEVQDSPQYKNRK